MNGPAKPEPQASQNAVPKRQDPKPFDQEPPARQRFDCEWARSAKQSVAVAETGEWTNQHFSQAWQIGQTLFALSVAQYSADLEFIIWK